MVDAAAVKETLFGFTATATDDYVPANTLTFSLAKGLTHAGDVMRCCDVTGVHTSAGGAFTWTPSEAQGPGTYRFTVVVTDDGTPNLADSEEISVTVNEVNVAPVLGAIGNSTVDEEALFSFTATATDHDVPANTLTFSLANGATSCGSVTSRTVPRGASTTPGGAFTWTPSEAQGPGTYRFTVVVTDDGTPNLAD